jgi:hypothetical protein
MKPEETRYRVKELNHKIFVIPDADAFHKAVGNTLTVGMRDCERLAGGLKTVVKCQEDRLESWDSHNAYSRLWINKSEKDKVIQMVLWESDKSIVAMKPRNRDEANGLIRMQETLRDTPSRYRAEVNTLTKFKSLTQYEEVFLSRERELHTRFYEGH